MSDLLFFRAVASTKSFVNASKELSVTQSAVSQRVKRLEERLGITLFGRQKTGMHLTAQGELLFNVVAQAFESIDNIVETISSGMKEKRVAISCVPSLALEWLTPRLTEFQKLRPDIAVSIHAEIEAPLHNKLGSFDIAVRYGPIPPKDGDLLFDHPEPVFPVLSPVLAKQIASDGKISLTLFHDAMPWAEPANPRTEWDMWIAANGQPVPNPTRDVMMNFAQICYRAAMDGDGLALGRKLVVSGHLHQGLLVRLENAPSIEAFRYFVVKRSGTSRPEIDVVARWLITQLRDDLRK